MYIRQATFDDRYALARILIDATFSAFHGRVPDECLGWIDVKESAQNWGETLQTSQDSEHLLVAEIDSVDVVGLILAGRSTNDLVQDIELSSRYPREVTSLQVTPAWQGKGIGRRLIRAAAENLLEGGDSGLLVRVLRDNPNVSFYNRLGAKRIGSQPYRWSGYDTHEELLVWENMRCLT